MPSRGYAVQEAFPLQPAYLGAGVSPGHVAFLVLDLPGHDDDHVAFPDPDALLHFTSYTAHPGDAIDAAHHDAAGAEHADHGAQHFSLFFIGRADPGYGLAFARMTRIVLSIQINTFFPAGPVNCDCRYRKAGLYKANIGRPVQGERKI